LHHTNRPIIYISIETTQTSIFHWDNIRYIPIFKIHREPPKPYQISTWHSCMWQIYHQTSQSTTTSNWCLPWYDADASWLSGRCWWTAGPFFWHTTRRRTSCLSAEHWAAVGILTNTVHLPKWWTSRISGWQREKRGGALKGRFLSKKHDKFINPYYIKAVCLPHDNITRNIGIAWEYLDVSEKYFKNNLILNMHFQLMQN
jgi:hypothetical protein